MTSNKITDRRRFLTGLGTVGAVGLSSISGCLSMWVNGSNGKGNYPPLQFASQQHRITEEMATQTATDRSSLIKAVRTPGATVWIPQTATIDMTGVVGVPVAPNVTIASNRLLNNGGGASNSGQYRRGGSNSGQNRRGGSNSGRNRRGGSNSSQDNQKGGVIKTDEYDKGIFLNDTGGCRITGLRLQGPRMDNFKPEGGADNVEEYSSLGFNFQGQTAIIDHCEVAGWTFAGIALGAKTKYTQGWIHHNNMHHNQMEHLGYPMELYNGLHLIEWNYFNYNRHSIAGFGYPTSGYEARFNTVGANAILHSFDMHHLGENLDDYKGSDFGRVAGSFVNIHHNVFELTSYPAFSIQGIPQRYARFCNNWCAEQSSDSAAGNSGAAVLFPDSADVRVKDNTYGLDSVGAGRDRLREIEPKLMDSQDPSTENPPEPTPTPMSLEEML